MGESQNEHLNLSLLQGDEQKGIFDSLTSNTVWTLLSMNSHYSICYKGIDTYKLSEREGQSGSDNRTCMYFYFGFRKDRPGRVWIHSPFPIPLFSWEAPSHSQAQFHSQICAGAEILRLLSVSATQLPHLNMPAVRNHSTHRT